MTKPAMGRRLNRFRLPAVELEELLDAKRPARPSVPTHTVGARDLITVLIFVLIFVLAVQAGLPAAGGCSSSACEHPPLGRLDSAPQVWAAVMADVAVDRSVCI